MSAVFQVRFPDQPWRASEPDAKPYIGCDPVETVSDFGVIEVPAAFKQAAPVREVEQDLPFTVRNLAIAVAVVAMVAFVSSIFPMGVLTP